MIETQEKAIDIKTRLIQHVKGKKQGPTMVFFAGIHGNEPAGVEALKHVLPKLNPDEVCGNIYGVYGNTKALKLNKRFIDADLNRIWTSDRVTKLQKKADLLAEEKEQKALYKFLKELLDTNKAPLYFIDFHTTSSKTLPFITINDALINRKFSKCFPVPIVLGIEEFLEGPLLSFLNKKGYVSLGFESGQHQDKEAIENCISFIYLATYLSGAIQHSKAILKNHFERLQSSAEFNNDIYEVIFKYHIKDNESFKMLPGFESFQPVEKGTLLANSNNQPIYASYSYELFMPLYQNRGNDGFFIIKKIAPFFLKLSAFLRKIKADNLLTILPGITWHNKSEGVLRANLKVTRFMAKAIFHLLGYRNKQEDDTHLLLYNRERVAKNAMYKNAMWYKSKEIFRKKLNHN